MHRKVRVGIVRMPSLLNILRKSAPSNNSF